MERKWISVILIVGLGILRLSLRCDRDRRQREQFDSLSNYSNYSQDYSKLGALQELADLNDHALPTTPDSFAAYQLVVGKERYDIVEGSHSSIDVLTTNKSGDGALLTLDITRSPTWTFDAGLFAFDYDSSLVVHGGKGEVMVQGLNNTRLEIATSKSSVETLTKVTEAELTERGFAVEPTTIAVGNSQVKCITGSQMGVVLTFASLKIKGTSITLSLTTPANGSTDQKERMLSIVRSLRASAKSEQTFDVEVSSAGTPQTLTAGIGKTIWLGSGKSKIAAHIEPRAKIRRTVLDRTFEHDRTFALGNVATDTIRAMTIGSNVVSVQFYEIPIGQASDDAFVSQMLTESTMTQSVCQREFNGREVVGKRLLGSGALAGVSMEVYTFSASSLQPMLIVLQYRNEDAAKLDKEFASTRELVEALASSTRSSR
jgi:hypothetical protein